MIIFAGDLHGQFHHLAAAVKRTGATALVLLGDIEATRPLEEELGEVVDMTELWWIIGNHDTDRDETFEGLFSSRLADRNLDGRVVEIDGRKIAGLGGIFREGVWTPPADPRFNSRSDLARWREGIARKHFSTIFPETVNSLSSQDAEILVCHEAPGCHIHGVEEIDKLARAMNVKSVFHGHHHDSPDYAAFEKDMKFKTFGVGLRGITDEFGNRVLAGERDLERNKRSFNDARRMTLYPNAFK